MSLWRRRKNEKLFVAEAADDRVPWILISWLTCYIHFSWCFIIRCNEVVFQYFATTRATHIYIYLGNRSYYNRFYSIPDQVKRIRRRFLPCIDWLGEVGGMSEDFQYSIFSANHPLIVLRVVISSVFKLFPLPLPTPFLICLLTFFACMTANGDINGIFISCSREYYYDRWVKN